MAPTFIHAPLSLNDDPSLGVRQMLQHFPATLWSLFYVGVVIVFFTLVISANILEGSRERTWCLRRMEWLDKMWAWLKGGNPREKAGAIDPEELRRLISHDGEGREGSVGGETLVDDEEVKDEDEDEYEQASKEEMELDSEGYMNGET